MSIMAKTPSGYKKIGSAYLGERPVDKVFNANGDVVYALQRELTGVPPLLFKGKEQSELLNYRIYGDTVDGESVGDRTGNLFDGNFLQGYWAYADGMRGSTSVTWITTSKLPCKPNTDYSFKSSYIGRYFGFVWFDSNGEYISSSCVSDTSSNMYVKFSSLSPVDAAYLIINIKSPCNTSTGDSFTITPSDVTDLMLNEGPTALPYEPYGYKVSVTVSNGTDTLTTPIYLPEQIRKVGDEAEYVDYAEQKWHRVRKNLLQNIATSQTRKGVTFTVNSDGSVTCNGTASATIDYRLVAFNSYLLPAGNYRLTGAPPTANYSSYYLRAWYDSSGSVKGFNDIGNGTNFSLTDTTILLCAIIIAPQQVLNNVTFYPMIRKADIEDGTYEPYIENTDLDVTLPALPTIKGTNTMSVDTEVQPSRMDIKGRIKSLT